MPRMKRSQRMSKRAFVLSLPFDLPAKEVVAKAKEAQLRIKPEYVYVVRSNAKQGKLGKRPGQSVAAGSLESEFRRLTIELGLDKSKELLKETERKVADLIRGQ